MMNSNAVYVVIVLHLFADSEVSAGECLNEDAKYFSSCPDSEIFARAGENRTLSCSRHKRISRCDWYMRNTFSGTSKPLQSNNDGIAISMNGAECILQLGIQSSSDGYYECVPQARGDMSPLPTASTKITVLRAPRLIGFGQRKAEDGTIKVIEGSDHELECKAEDASPPPVYVWRIDEEEVSSYAVDGGDISTLRISSLENLYQYHKGTVSCRIEHKTLQEPLEDRATLNIFFRPRILQKKDAYRVERLGMSMDIPFLIKSNPEIDTSQKFITITDPSGVRHSLKPGDKTFSQIYSLSKMKPSEDDDGEFEVVLSVSNVSEEVLDSTFVVTLANTAGLTSEPYIFSIMINESGAVFLIGLLAAGFGVVFLGSIAVVMVYKKRTRERSRRSSSIWKDLSIQESINSVASRSESRTSVDNTSENQAPPLPHKRTTSNVSETSGHGNKENALYPSVEDDENSSPEKPAN